MRGFSAEVALTEVALHCVSPALSEHEGKATASVVRVTQESLLLPWNAKFLGDMR